MKKPSLKKRFALPVVVAGLVHATLLFGFRNPGAIPGNRGGDADPPIEWKFPPQDPVEAPRKLEDATSDFSAKPLRAKELPGIPDLPVSTPDPGVISMPVQPTRPWVSTGKSTLHLPDGVWRTGSDDANRIGGHILSSLDLDSPPRVKFQISPEYPYSLRHEGISGEVLVELLVDETGRVIDARILRSSHPGFESAVLRAVAKWRFDSGKRHGRPVRFRLIAPLTFNLGE